MLDVVRENSTPNNLNPNDNWVLILLISQPFNHEMDDQTLIELLIRATFG